MQKFVVCLCCIFLLGLASDKVLAAAPSGESSSPPAEASLPAGFIAYSGSEMNYADAVAFCKSHGGRLPRINNSNSWDGKNPPLRGILIDSFGYGGRPWSEVGLPGGTGIWTSTAMTGFPGSSWVVYGGGGDVDVLSVPQTNELCTACVPK